MSGDLKKSIPFIGEEGVSGTNTLAHPRSLPKGMHPLIKNFFPYELGCLEKRKGSRHLNIQTISGTKQWVISDTAETPQTAFVDNKTIPRSNIGIKNILAHHHYSAGGRNMMIAVVDTYDVAITGSETFTVTEVPGGGSFAYCTGTTYFQLFWKTASGLKFVKEVSISVNPANSYTFSVGSAALPSNVQFAVIGFSATSFSAGTAGIGGVYSCPIAIIGTNGASYTATEDGIIGSSVHKLAATIWSSGVDASDYESFDFCDMGGLTALYSADTVIAGDAFMSQLYVSGSSKVGGVGTGGPIFASKMPRGTERILSQIGGYDNTLFPEQQCFQFIENGDYVYLPTVAGKFCNHVNTAGTDYDGWDASSDYVPSTGALNGLKVWSGRWPFICATSGREFGYCETGYGLGTTDLKALITRTFASPPRAQYACTYKGRIICSGNPYNPVSVYHSSTIAPDQAESIRRLAPMGAIGVGETAFYRANNATEIIGEDEGSGSSSAEVNGVDTFTRTSITTGIEAVLCVFKRRSHFVVYGDWVDESSTGSDFTDDFAIKQLSKRVGLLSPLAKSHTNQGLFFLGENNAYYVNTAGEPTGVASQVSNLFAPTYTNSYDYIYRFNDHSYCSFYGNILRICYSADGIKSTYGDPYDDTTIRKEIWIDLRPEAKPAAWGPHEFVYPGCPDDSQLGLATSSGVKIKGYTVPPLFAQPRQYDIKTLYDKGSSVYTPMQSAFVGSVGRSFIALDCQKYTEIGGYNIESEFISAEDVFDYPSLLKSFFAIGLTVDAVDTGTLFTMVTTDAGLDDLGRIDYIENPKGEFDASDWDEVYWEGKTYPFKKILLTQRPLGRSARVRMIHRGTENIKITNLELFFKITRRSYL